MTNVPEDGPVLSPEEKRALLARLLEADAGDTDSPPMSFAQERLWRLERMEPGSSVYNVIVAVRLEGPLQAAVLERALNEILRRHESLRTNFTDQEGRPVQKIRPAAALSLHQIDLRVLPQAQREAEAMRHAARIALEPFDLGHDLLVRASLLTLDTEDHVFVLTTHHIITDRWSIDILIKELTALYEAFLNNGPSPLPELPIQYADFAAWQRESVSAGTLEPQRAYWRTRLSGHPSPLELPLDHSRPAAPSYRGTRRSFALTRQLTDELKDLSRRRGVTLFMTLLAAYKILLHRYTGQQDIIVCSPVAGRNRRETEPLIGYLNNVLPLRTDFSGSPSLEEILERVHQTTLGAYTHQEVPFQFLSELPEMVRVPLSRTMFALQNTLREPLALPGITATTLSIDKGAVNFDLALIFEEQAGALIGAIEYKTDLFGEETINGMLGNLQTLLGILATDPGRLLSSLPVYSSPKVGRQGPDAQAGAASFLAPRTPTEARLAQIWEEILDTRPIGAHDNFFALGGHSLMVVRLIDRIKQEFNKDLPPVTVFRSPTVAELGRVISPAEQAPAVSDSGGLWPALLKMLRKLPFFPKDPLAMQFVLNPRVIILFLRNRFTKSPSPLAVIKNHGKMRPFFCVPGGIGFVIYFYHLARYLDPDQPFYGFRSVAIDGRVEPYLTIEKMATDYVKEMKTIQPQGPYLLGGHSYGGAVAFEMARQLQRAGEKVSLLAIMDTPAPVFGRTAPGVQEKDGNWLTILAELAELSYGIKLGISTEAMKGLDREQQLDYFVDQIQHFKLLPFWLSPRLLRGVANVLRASIQAQMNYAVPEVYPDRVTLFRASEFSGRTAIIRSVQSEAEALKYAQDPTLGWAPLSSLPIEVHDIQADHFTLMTEPQVRQLGERLRDCISSALAKA